MKWSWFALSSLSHIRGPTLLGDYQAAGALGSFSLVWVTRLGWWSFREQKCQLWIMVMKSSSVISTAQALRRERTNGFDPWNMKSNFRLKSKTGKIRQVVRSSVASIYHDIVDRWILRLWEGTGREIDRPTNVLAEDDLVKSVVVATPFSEEDSIIHKAFGD